jgi:hypothetical protein
MRVPYGGCCGRHHQQQLSGELNPGFDGSGGPVATAIATVRTTGLTVTCGGNVVDALSASGDLRLGPGRGRSARRAPSAAGLRRRPGHHDRDQRRHPLSGHGPPDRLHARSARGHAAVRRRRSTCSRSGKTAPRPSKPTRASLAWHSRTWSAPRPPRCARSSPRSSIASASATASRTSTTHRTSTARTHRRS